MKIIVHKIQYLFTTGFSVSLINGTSAISGLVSLKRFGLDGKMCANNWNNAASDVVCRQLGFVGGMTYGYSYTRLDMPVWGTSVNCTGNETSIEQCVSSVWGTPVYQGCFANRVLCYRSGKCLRIVFIIQICCPAAS